MSRTVAITGASGFIGQHIIAALLGRGVTVRALTRRPVEGLDSVTWVEGSLEDEQSLAMLVRGAAAVIHCAGQVRGRSRAVFQACNVDGTLRLVRAAKAAGSERFLLFSSLAARHPELSWYAESKFAAEHAAIEVAGDMRLSVFRPTAVYGPGDRELQPLFASLLRGWLPRLGRADAQLSFLHVHDLAQATLRWLEVDAIHAARYELNDGARTGYGWQRLAAIGAATRGAPVRVISVSAPLLRLLSQLNLAWHRLAGGEPMLTPSKVNELVHPDWSSSNRKISQDLGWSPGIVLERALSERLF
ncbi:NAD-dependent epimerase/dehydratase family protein [Pseudomonas capeferrum]|uniref:NAD-dependent epimerase/dehydratase family protein n=1 Tax=Pseudomonas capeferrum TaxID=1495066 RepID=UPI0015E2E9DE|nr:NAD-dependent epimerase/dehydratase family protein [Pseudomonas capeferrum]MBA1200198.1 NAD-dependent epimerase/dehydratase family protein [Pseudomonas capeferrum]